MAVGGGGVEALFYRGPITPGDVASWLEPGVLEDGGSGGGGGVPSYIFLTSNVVVDTAVAGTTIGTLSVIGLTGFSYSIIYDPGGLFAISGSDLVTGVNLSSANDGMQPVVIQAFDGVTTYKYGYVIFVIPGAAPPTFVPTYYIYGF